MYGSYRKCSLKYHNYKLLFKSKYVIEGSLDRKNIIKDIDNRDCINFRLYVKHNIQKDISKISKVEHFCISQPNTGNCTMSSK